MKLNKKFVAALALGALAASAVPAMAVENEFHGMYKAMFFTGNAFNGLQINLNKNDHTSTFAEQRARLQYIAKQSADLKLVTHFELDTRFGGKNIVSPSGYLGTYSGNDGGQLDADSLTLETKNIYLDFNAMDTNFKVGMQPWADAYQSVFLLADMTGVYATRKYSDITASVGWFRYYDLGVAAEPAGRKSNDLVVLDAKYPLNKDMTIGASYYNVQNDTGSKPSAELLHMLGVNAALKFGTVAVNPFAAFQFGEKNANDDLSGVMLGATGNVKLGPGAINFAGLFLSGDKDNKGGDFKIVSTSTSYFNAANMWLLVRNGQQINSSTSILGNDLTVGGRGLILLTGGYAGTMDKIFYNANIGLASAVDAKAGEDEAIGTEINAQVGYKLMDNLNVSAAFAYCMLGDGMTSATKKMAGFGAVDAADPYMVNAQISYTF